MYRNVSLLLCQHEFHMDLFVLPINGVELVLEVHWLKTLGHIITGYEKLTMSFNIDGSSVHLKGVPKASPIKQIYTNYNG